MTTTTTTTSTSNNNNNNTSGTTPTKKWLPRLFFSRSPSQGADIISTHTDDRPGDTEFFASLEARTDLAFLDRHEVKVGEMVGKGAFTATRAVVGIVSNKKKSNTNDTLLPVQELEASMWVITSNTTAATATKQPRYTLKQLTPQTLQASDPRTKSRAARELVNDAKYLARLGQHPNIVTLRGINRDAFSRNYLAHQFEDFFLLRDNTSPLTLHDKIYKTWSSAASSSTATSSSNNDSLQQEEPDEDLIPIKANYALQIAKALRYCHSQGVLYRDLKPSNISFGLLDPHCVQLMEFGLARDIPNHSTNNSHNQHSTTDAPFRMTLAGTRRYLAGEVLTSGAYTCKSDVYSWAMVYYEMCTERKPYQGLSVTEHQQYVCQDGNRPNLDDCYLPEALDIILTQAWHPVLSQRWSMEEICNHMLQFLMELDICYYQQQEGDFLFDIDSATPIDVKSWTEEWGQDAAPPVQVMEEVAMPSYSHLLLEESEASIAAAREGDSSEEEGMKSSDVTQGTAAQRRASLSSVEAVTPRKIISSAA